MTVMLKKLQQKYARIKDEMVRWDELQSQLLSQFGNASSIINRLQMLTEDENYGALIILPGIKEALLAKQTESLEMIFTSMMDTVKEFDSVVLSLDKIARDGEQLVRGSTQYQMQLDVGIQPSLQQCLDGLNTFHKMYKSEFLLKSSILSSLMLNYLKCSADDIAMFRLLLVDQPNIPKDEVQTIFDIVLTEVADDGLTGKEGVSTRSSLESETQANLQEVLLTPMVFEQGTALEEEGFNPPVPQDFIDGVGIDQENVVEKVIGLHEVSDEVHANLREIESVHERSDLGINLTENLRMENLMPDGENQELQPKPVKQLDSKKVDSFSEKEDIQFQYLVLRSDDAGISVNQQSNLNNSLDQHSAMEQQSALKLNAGSSIIPLDGDVEIKNAKLNLHIPQPSVLDTVLPGQQSSLETVASSTSESTFDNSRNSPKSLNSKDKLEPSEYELNKNQHDLLI